MPRIRIHDGPHEVSERLLQLKGSRPIADLDTVTLAPNEAGLAQHLNVLG